MVAGRQSDSDGLAPALARGIRILDLLAAAQGRPMALSDVSRSLGAAKSSTLNLCVVLEQSGLIRKLDSGYVLGHRTVELGGAYLRSFNEMREFYQFCADAPVLSAEVVQVAMLDGSDVVYLARHEGQSPLRLTANIGDRFPAAPTAVGNALLAALTDADVVARFSDPDAFPRRTENSVRTLDGLLEKLRRVRQLGFATDEHEVHPGLSGIAVRVPPRSSSAPALAVGCTFITATTSESQRAGIIAELRALQHLLGNPMQLLD